VKDVAPDTCHLGPNGVLLMEDSTMKLTDSTLSVFQFQHAWACSNTQVMKLTATNADLVQLEEDGELDQID
jgi:hypothetical protein